MFENYKRYGKNKEKSKEVLTLKHSFTLLKILHIIFLKNTQIRKEIILKRKNTIFTGNKEKILKILKQYFKIRNKYKDLEFQNIFYQ